MYSPELQPLAKQTLNADSVLAAHIRNQAHDSLVQPARFIEAPALAREIGAASIHFLWEGQQTSGAFKYRGAINAVRNVAEDEDRDIVYASAGNHGRAVSMAAAARGLHSVGFMPVNTPASKQRAVQSSANTTLHLVGQTVDESLEAAQQYAAEHDAIFIHPFNNLDVIHGNGTLAVEILDRLPQANSIILPAGGGGLLSGVGAYARSARPDIHLVAAEPQDAASLTYALQTGQSSIGLQTIDTFIDGAAVRAIGDYAFEELSTYGDMLDVVKISRCAARKATTELWTKHGLRAELASSLPLAAARIIGKKLVDRHVVLGITGSSLSIERFEQEVKID